MGLELDMALRITMDDTRQGYTQKCAQKNEERYVKNLDAAVRSLTVDQAVDN